MSVLLCLKGCFSYQSCTCLPLDRSFKVCVAWPQCSLFLASISPLAAGAAKLNKQRRSTVFLRSCQNSHDNMTKKKTKQALTLVDFPDAPLPRGSVTLLYEMKLAHAKTHDISGKTARLRLFGYPCSKIEQYDH